MFLNIQCKFLIDDKDCKIAAMIQVLTSDLAWYFSKCVCVCVL